MIIHQFFGYICDENDKHWVCGIILIHGNRNAFCFFCLPLAVASSTGDHLVSSFYSMAVCDTPYGQVIAIYCSSFFVFLFVCLSCISLFCGCDAQMMTTYQLPVRWAICMPVHWWHAGPTRSSCLAPTNSPSADCAQLCHLYPYAFSVLAANNSDSYAPLLRVSIRGLFLRMIIFCVFWFFWMVCDGGWWWWWLWTVCFGCFFFFAHIWFFLAMVLIGWCILRWIFVVDLFYDGIFEFICLIFCLFGLIFRAVSNYNIEFTVEM